jgi:hypothetical protein
MFLGVYFVLYDYKTNIFYPNKKEIYFKGLHIADIKRIHYNYFLISIANAPSNIFILDRLNKNIIKIE